MVYVNEVRSLEKQAPKDTKQAEQAKPEQKKRGRPKKAAGNGKESV